MLTLCGGVFVALFLTALVTGCGIQGNIPVENAPPPFGTSEPASPTPAPSVPAKTQKPPRTLPPLKPAVVFSYGGNTRFYPISIEDWKHKAHAWRGVAGCDELNDAFHEVMIAYQLQRFGMLTIDDARHYRRAFLDIMDRLRIGDSEFTGPEYEFEHELRFAGNLY